MAKKNNESAIADLTEIRKYPFLTMNNVVVYPYTLAPLVIEGEDVIKMVEDISNNDRYIVLFSELPPTANASEDGVDLSGILDSGVNINAKTKVAPTGVLARIVKMLRFPDGSVRVLVRGLSRVALVEKVKNSKKVIVQKIVEGKSNDIEVIAMAKNALGQFQEIIKFAANFPEELRIAILNVNDNIRMTDLIADAININFIEKLSILTLETLHERLQLLTILLNRELEVLELGSEIQLQVHNTLGKSQREFFLREQLKTIKKELGEDSQNPDVVNITKRMKELDLPKDVIEVIEKEIERLEMIHQASGEYHIVYSYIDWLLLVPWSKYTDDRLDINEAENILNKDHYGLNDVKELILDFLAVLQLKKDKKSPVICFVGPPGVGKTSLGQSIAKAMGRKFVRMSLGGIKDEAEIRGHRRTYIGSMPGRIIQAMKKANSSNPVIMLDEIDKIGNDFRGDPSSALLEVLDPQQNHSFNDHYLEVDYDLSSVMFIATANILDTIPPALRDRMEIIRLSGYTANEKREIAKRFLVSKQLKGNGIKQRQLGFSMQSIDEIINYYTREAGVRNLERTIGKVCRKTARELVSSKTKNKKRILLSVDDIKKYLGAKIFLMDEAELLNDTGVAVGMAWTSVGGTILLIEATKMSGKGDLKLTGSLGDVMKESAQTAFSFIRSNAKELKIKNDVFMKNDFHIHVPDGATPKDGPSAGITITTALISLLTNRQVSTLTSMTGEITLSGKITPVGGIKEKVIAALRAGIKTVVLPDKNKKDLDEIPKDIQRKLKFKFVNNIKDAIKFTLK